MVATENLKKKKTKKNKEIRVTPLQVFALSWQGGLRKI